MREEWRIVFVDCREVLKVLRFFMRWIVGAICVIGVRAAFDAFGRVCLFVVAKETTIWGFVCDVVEAERMILHVIL